MTSDGGDSRPGTTAPVGGAEVATVAGKPFASPAPSQAGKPHAHSGDLGVPGVSERELRKFETAVLGPEHARQHALVRSAKRDGELPVEEPADDGPVARAAAVGPPEQDGRWSAPFDIPVMAIHSALLPTGKVMWFSYPKNPAPRHGGSGVVDPNESRAWLWDPATGQTKRMDPPLWRDPEDGQLKPANIWCAGQTFTADGGLVVFGGNLVSRMAPST